MKLVILSTNHNLYSTRRLVEAGKKKGHDMHVIDHSKCDLVIEKRKPGLIYKGKEIEGVDGVIPRIGASITFYGTAVVRHFDTFGLLVLRGEPCESVVCVAADEGGGCC